MPLKTIPFHRLEPLIRRYLSKEEDEPTAELLRQLRPAKIRGYLRPAELEAVCHSKSARAIHYIRSNPATSIRSATRAAFMTRSERLRLEHLTRLKGVSIPMASALLMLMNPTRYGVIDIRVWQLLYELGAVTKNAAGVGFRFNNWYQYLMIIRHFAKKFGVKARDIERTLFRVHKEYQAGRLYKYGA